MANEASPAHLPTLTDIKRWPQFTPERPLKVLVSACITGVLCGSDATAYGAPYPHTAHLLACSNVVPVPFCPEDFVLGTPREIPDIHGGNGFDVLDGKARVVTSAGSDCTDAMIEAAKAMLAIAQREQVRLALLLDVSAACGSQVIYLGDRSFGVYQRGQGVCAALLTRHRIPIVSPRDLKTFGAIVHHLDPNVVPAPSSLDHHESEWYRSYFGGSERTAP